jgi:hypothetical protein
MNKIEDILKRITEGKGDYSEIVGIGADVFLGIVRAVCFSLSVVEARQQQLKYADIAADAASTAESADKQSWRNVAGKLREGARGNFVSKY